MEMKCITHGSLRTSRSKFNPESGQIEFSMKVEDPDWEPRQGRINWNPKFRIFTEVSLAKLISHWVWRILNGILN